MSSSPSSASSAGGTIESKGSPPAATAGGSTRTDSNQSPQLSPRGAAGGNGNGAAGSIVSPTSSPAAAGGGGGFFSDVLSYWYNGKASISAAINGETRLADDRETWVLGIFYRGEKTTEWVSRKVNCISYFTYRNKIPVPLPRSSGLNHDAGWGCMIRTGQMMFHECLTRVFDRARECEKSGELDSGRAPAGIASVQCQVLMHSTGTATLRSWFQDTPTAPFGLHSMAAAGAQFHIPVGDWFNPTALSHCLTKLAAEHEPTNKILKVVMAKDGLLVRSEVEEALTGKDSYGIPRSVLVLIPQRLGPHSTIAPAFYQSFLRCFNLPSTLGVVGGKPKASLYFVGYQDDNVFYLDPHVVQPAYVSDDTAGNIMGPRGTTKLSSVDSSVLLCFVFHGIEEFQVWEQEFKANIHSLTEYPLFEIGKAPSIQDLEDDDLMYMDDTPEEGKIDPATAENPSRGSSCQTKELQRGDVNSRNPDGFRLDKEKNLPGLRRCGRTG